MERTGEAMTLADELRQRNRAADTAVNKALAHDPQLRDAVLRHWNMSYVISYTEMCAIADARDPAAKAQAVLARVELRRPTPPEPIRGGHVDLLILDDIESNPAPRSPETVAALKQFLAGVQLSPGGPQ